MLSPPGTAPASSAPAGLLTVTQAAQLAGGSRSVVVGWITSGRLSVEWIDHRRSVWLRDVLAT